jgi:hypothetical protein
VSEEAERRARREDAARRYDQVADELELAVAHLRTTARHFRDAEIPRACAHAWAARGHRLNARALLDALASEHASRSAP